MIDQSRARVLSHLGLLIRHPIAHNDIATLFEQGSSLFVDLCVRIGAVYLVTLIGSGPLERRVRV